jgi:signal transduction histidine kinase
VGTVEPNNGTVAAPLVEEQGLALFDRERRKRNVQGLSAGIIVASATILAFTPMEWIILRPYFITMQGLRVVWIAALAGVWIALKRKPLWAARAIDDLVFTLFLFVCLFNCILVWLHGAYDSPYTLTLLFILIGVNFFISWTPTRAAVFGVSVYAVFLLPMAFGLVAVGDAKITVLYQAVVLGTIFILVGFQRHRLSFEKREFLSRLELQQTKATLQDAYEQLQEVDRVKSEFFANVSHELRTPLTLILSPVDELLEKMTPSGERDALKVVRRNATRLLRMIDDLLDLARLEAGGLRLRIMQFDPCDLSRRIVENATPAARAKDIELVFDANCTPAERYGDPHRIEIILTNLVGNAMKFTPPGGRIQVSVFHNPAGTSIEVTDTGPGIPREEHQRIFERFHQTETSERRQQGGVGIGLALARELTHLHGGSLTVESQLGEGSTFTLFLKSGKDHFHTEIMDRRQLHMEHHPGRRVEDRTTAVHTRQMEEATVEMRKSQRPPERIVLDRGRLPRVLVAEDELDLRGFIVGVLKDTYEVDAAGDGAEALELMKKNRPDLVLTDVMMPGTSGLDLTRAIKEDPSLRHIPVILLTARGESEAALQGYDAGADDFVSKPFHTKVLEARIRAHLKMRGLSLQLADQARLASAGTLAAGLAHEVKNPLNAAVNAARVLEKGGSTRVSNEKLMNIVIDALTRIDGVISALDAHARPADGTDIAPCNVRTAVESTLNLLEHKMKHVTVHEDYGAAGDVFAPARAFNQVLLNLVDNSIRSGAKNVWIELRQEDTQVAVSVADDGPGVPHDMAHRIFDPFFTTRVEGEGTGLGLHLSRRIAQECGGELRYEPRPGGGARFVMEIPAMEEAA